MEVDLDGPKGESLESSETDPVPSRNDQKGETMTETENNDIVDDNTTNHFNDYSKKETETDSLSHDVTHDSEDDSSGSDSDDDTIGPDSIAGDECSNPSLGDKDSENRSKKGKKRRGARKSKIKKKQKQEKKNAKIRSNNPVKQKNSDDSSSHAEKAVTLTDKKGDVTSKDEPVFGMALRSRTNSSLVESSNVDTGKTENVEKQLPTFFEDLNLNKPSAVSSSKDQGAKSKMATETSDGEKTTKDKRNLKVRN
ncbi:hypothetical protein DPMN_054326 [Dreissena polymorpha]|uniref:Uncharacterized protein n=1 Tax=Dreissena polymorpha TaxID=45954 RepID=A0A9D4CNP8_DREPO|nr:hypothetical protein DPMN_054326 [Dreissena polymorpha]